MKKSGGVSIKFLVHVLYILVTGCSSQYIPSNSW